MTGGKGGERARQSPDGLHKPPATNSPPIPPSEISPKNCLGILFCRYHLFLYSPVPGVNLPDSHSHQSQRKMWIRVP